MYNYGVYLTLDKVLHTPNKLSYTDQQAQCRAVSPSESCALTSHFLFSVKYFTTSICP